MKYRNEIFCVLFFFLKGLLILKSIQLSRYSLSHLQATACTFQINDLPMTKMVNFWNDPGVIVITTDWTTTLTPS